MKSSTTTAGGREVLLLDNTGGALTGPVQVIAGSPTGTMSGAFSITAQYANLEGETCAAPELLNASPGVPQSTTYFLNNIGTSSTAANNCAGASSPGPDRVYQVTLQAGEVLNVGVTPSAGWNSVVYLLPATASCASSGTVCLAGDNRGAAGQLDRLVYRNTSGADATYLLVVDGTGSDQWGEFELTVAFEQPVCGNGVVDATEQCDDGAAADGDGCSAVCTIEEGYSCIGNPSLCQVVFQPIAAGCADMTGAIAQPLTATSSTFVATDEGVTSPAPLPFTLSLYGQPQTHFMASSNGFMFLGGSGLAVPTTNFFTNASEVPSSATPNGWLGVFWDDLQDTAITTLSTPQSLIVEWNTRLFGADFASSSMRFQLHLSDTGAVAYHYCAADLGSTTVTGAADRLAGNSATIAAESADGTVGNAISINNTTAPPITWGTSAWELNIN